MKTEIESIIASLQEVLSGNPWYGKSLLAVLNGIDPSIVHKKPDSESHSIIELLYHMVTWAEFTERRLAKDKNMDLEAFRALDWRKTDPETHTWNNGISEFTSEINKIIKLLKDSGDEILEDKVDYREYNFRYLLNGLIHHNIYHIGQIAYVNKLFS